MHRNFVQSAGQSGTSPGVGAKVEGHRRTAGGAEQMTSCRSAGPCSEGRSHLIISFLYSYIVDLCSLLFPCDFPFPVCYCIHCHEYQLQESAIIMYKLNTTSVSLAVTPTVVSTLFSHVCTHTLHISGISRRVDGLCPARWPFGLHLGLTVVTCWLHSISNENH